MRKVASFLIFMLMLTICCNKVSQYEHVLVDIDSLTVTDADSARRMLQRMNQKMENADEDTKAYYNLLRVKASLRPIARLTLSASLPDKPHIC